MDRFIKDVVRDQPDFIVFLDKSARPLAWLFRERIKHLFPTETIPSIRFINIGSENYIEKMIHENEKAIFTFERKRVMERKWREAVNQDNPFVGISEDGVAEQQEGNLDEDSERVHQIQKIFGDQFSGKNILFVDEITLTGKSLEVASELFTKAFPDLKSVHTTAFFNQDFVSSFDSNTDLMPWFKTPGLIGVFDIFDEKALLAKRVDKNSVEEAKKRILEEKGQALNNLNEFVKKNEEEMYVQFNTIRSFLKDDWMNDKKILKDLEWIETLLRITKDEKAQEKELYNWLINTIQQIPPVITFFKNFEKRNKYRGIDFPFARTVSLLEPLRKIAHNALVALNRSNEITNIESKIGDVRKLRAELKALANQND